MTIIAQQTDILFSNPLPLWKRAMDIVGATLGLLASLPVSAITALYIACISPGPVFYKCKRVGYNGETFTMWKFRTMTDGDASAHQDRMKDFIRGSRRDAPMTKRENDPRLIPFARVIRKSCIDEIPQFINVLRGEMSLVGPRPALPYETNEFSPWHHAREHVVPGMTGLWQVSGKNRLTFQEMVALDIRYSREVSFRLDVRILLATFPAILLQVVDRSGVLRRRAEESKRETSESCQRSLVLSTAPEGQELRLD